MHMRFITYLLPSLLPTTTMPALQTHLPDAVCTCTYTFLRTVLVAVPRVPHALPATTTTLLLRTVATTHKVCCHPTFFKPATTTTFVSALLDLSLWHFTCRTPYVSDHAPPDTPLPVVHHTTTHTVVYAFACLVPRTPPLILRYYHWILLPLCTHWYYGLPRVICIITFHHWFISSSCRFPTTAVAPPTTFAYYEPHPYALLLFDDLLPYGSHTYPTPYPKL